MLIVLKYFSPINVILYFILSFGEVSRGDEHFDPMIDLTNENVMKIK